MNYQDQAIKLGCTHEDKKFTSVYCHKYYEFQEKLDDELVKQNLKKISDEEQKLKECVKQRDNRMLDGYFFLDDNENMELLNKCNKLFDKYDYSRSYQKKKYKISQDEPKFEEPNMNDVIANIKNKNQK